MFRRFATTTLLLIIAVSLLLITLNNTSDKVVLKTGDTYYTPGQFNDCKWLMSIGRTLTSRPGDSTPVRIGIPSKENGGYVKGVIESGPNNNLILAFKPLGLSEVSPPIIMTAVYDLSSVPLPIVKFTWFRSSTMVINLYKTEAACLAAAKNR
jgi:hypothetical protein